MLARATTTVQTVLEGSPTNEETMYWFGLLVDTPLPLVGHSAQRPHQSLSADGDRNIVDGVKYIASGVALDADGPDRIGAVMLVDELVFTAREITKTDARPGGYEATGGHGGVVADMGGYGPPEVTFLPARRHTWCSDLRLTVLPDRVGGVTGSLAGGIRTVDVPVKDEEGGLLPSAMPVVTITKYSRYTTAPTSAADLPDLASEVEVLARTAANLEQWPLSGFVEEGMSPYGVSDPTTDAALTLAVFAGMARMLLMAALLKFGALPPAADPARPTAAEQAATAAAVAAYQAVFDTH